MCYSDCMIQSKEKVKFMAKNQKITLWSNGLCADT